MKKLWLMLLAMLTTLCFVSCGETETPSTTQYTVSVTETLDEGGDVTGAGKYDKGTKVTLSATTNEGYTFEGWYDGDALLASGETYSFTVKNDITLTAKWAVADTDPVDPDNGDDNVDTDPVDPDNGDDNVDTDPVDPDNGDDNVDTDPVDPDNGDDNTGDNTGDNAGDNTGDNAGDNTGDNAGDNTGDNAGDNTPQSYTVQFDANGGSLVSSQTVTENEYATKPETAPTKTGYDFDGWCLNGVAYDFDTPITADITLTAQWRLIEYTIAYEDAQGATNGNPTTYTVESETITLQALTAEGYRFDGWYNGETKVTEIVQGSTGDITLTAKWSKTYTVTVTKNIDEAGSVENAGTYPESTSVMLKVTTNDGYAFEGWYDETDTLVTADTSYTVTLTSDIKLTAKWRSTAKTVTVNQNIELAGSVEGAGTYAENAEATLIATTNEGYLFDGWYDETGVLLESNATYTFKVVADITVTAKWSEREYTLDEQNILSGYNFTTDLTAGGTLTDSSQASGALGLYYWGAGVSETPSIVADTSFGGATSLKVAGTGAGALSIDNLPADEYMLTMKFRTDNGEAIQSLLWKQGTDDAAGAHNVAWIQNGVITTDYSNGITSLKKDDTTGIYTWSVWVPKSTAAIEQLFLWFTADAQTIYVSELKIELADYDYDFTNLSESVALPTAEGRGLRQWAMTGNSSETVEDDSFGGTTSLKVTAGAVGALSIDVDGISSQTPYTVTMKFRVDDGVTLGAGTGLLWKWNSSISEAEKNISWIVEGSCRTDDGLGGTLTQDSNGIYTWTFEAPVPTSDDAQLILWSVSESITLYIGSIMIER